MGGNVIFDLLWFVFNWYVEINKNFFKSGQTLENFPTGCGVSTCWVGIPNLLTGKLVWLESIPNTLKLRPIKVPNFTEGGVSRRLAGCQNFFIFWGRVPKYFGHKKMMKKNTQYPKHFLVFQAEGFHAPRFQNYLLWFQQLIKLI